MKTWDPGTLVPRLGDFKEGKDERKINFIHCWVALRCLQAPEWKFHSLCPSSLVLILSADLPASRAQFSCNFLACAGYKVIDNLGFKTVEEGVDAALEAKADIVVICSSDDEYAEYAIPAFKYLNGRAMFVVAGAPACMEDLKAAGIENFVHVKCNVLETLKEYNQKLGI